MKDTTTKVGNVLEIPNNFIISHLEYFTAEDSSKNNAIFFSPINKTFTNGSLN